VAGLLFVIGAAVVFANSAFAATYYLSATTTLVRETVVLIGTPEGVGMAAKPGPQWLQNGDTVKEEIKKIGILSNPVALEQTTKQAE